MNNYKTPKGLKIIENIHTIDFEITGNETMALLYENMAIKTHKPKHNRNKKLSIESVTFNHENMILVDKGRITGEKSVILIENNEYKGYAYTDLRHQINNLDILKSLINGTENYNLQNMIIKKYLSGNKVQVIIRF